MYDEKTASDENTKYLCVFFICQLGAMSKRLEQTKHLPSNFHIKIFSYFFSFICFRYVIVCGGNSMLKSGPDNQPLDVANTFINLGFHSSMVHIYGNLQVRQRTFQ